MSCVKDERKSAFLSDSLLGRRELKQKIVFTKIIKATTNLNSYFGEGKFSRTQLWERVNCYLEKDSFKSICLRTFDNYLRRIKKFNYNGLIVFASRSHKLGENRGSTFTAQVSPDAIYYLNKFFYEKKVAVVRPKKIRTLEYKKIAGDIIYLENLFTSPLSYKPKESLRSSQRSHSSQEKRTLVSTERIYDKSFLGTGAYKQALKDLEGMEVSREHTIEIERILINSIAKENATLNLRDFLKDLETDKRQSGVQVYLRELKALKGSIRLMRKGSQKYTKILEEVLNPPKTNFKTNRILSVYEENEKYNITPATPEEADEIWGDWFAKKNIEKNNKALGVYPMYKNEFMSVELDPKKNPQEDSQGDFLKITSALSLMNQILKKE